ncbi:zinc ribbon domain-containing protein [Streptomyces erythrochromogenes]
MPRGACSAGCRRRWPPGPDVRTWQCESCGTEHDRDFNASCDPRRRAGGEAERPWRAGKSRRGDPMPGTAR